jgi:hypothetical protein
MIAKVRIVLKELEWLDLIPVFSSWRCISRKSEWILFRFMLEKEVNEC